MSRPPIVKFEAPTDEMSEPLAGISFVYQSSVSSVASEAQLSANDTQGAEGTVDAEVAETSSTADKETSASDPDEERYFEQYRLVLTDIDSQNHLIDDIKRDYRALCQLEKKPADWKKIAKDLRQRMEIENCRLNTLVYNAMRLQNFGPHMRYSDIAIATTIEEDDMMQGQE